MALLPNTAAFGAAGPPPQSVLDKRPLWHLLIVLLAFIALLRMLTLDVVGGVLSGLMLCMAVLMVSDGMQEMSRYALVFGILCSLCFFFDMIPFVGSLAGRSQVIITPLKASRHDDVTRLTYNTTVRTTPFFDGDQGLVYNGNSLAMTLSPFIMFLGALLSFHAHVQLERAMEASVEDPMWLPSASPISGHGRIPNTSPGFVGYASGATMARFQGTGRRLSCD